MKKRNISHVIIAITMAMAMLAGCGGKISISHMPEAVQETTDSAITEAPVTSEAPEEAPEEIAEVIPGKSVSIIYTNDSHTYIHNVSEDDEGNEILGNSFANVAAYTNEQRDAGKNVILVDAGDHSQGTAYGGMDEGASIIEIMNAAGYELATLGNHEFDYGMFKTFENMEKAEFPYISCNFYNVEDGSLVLPACMIVEWNDVSVAFVGISTPESYTKAAPAYFQDEKGEFIYGFYAGDDGQDLYDSVQLAIDSVRDSADYVIGLGHLGIDPSSEPYRSTDVIANTVGLDAFIDGHSHHTVEQDIVKNKEGNPVVLTQTGSDLACFGEMTISEEGEITCRLISDYDKIDENVQLLEDEWCNSVNEILGEQIAVTDDDFYINNPDNPEERLIRRMETNLGDFCADASYYYLNMKEELPCDATIINGGGIRTDVAAGPLSYLSAKGISPFGNVICLVELTGQQILDALEMGARNVGVTDPETGLDAESGNFLHVAGMKYDIDSSIESTISLSEEGTFLEGPSGDYKVSNVQIYNRETGEYEDMDVSKTYRIGGINYALRNSGDGLSMLADSVLVKDFVTEDYLCLAEYMSAFAGVDADGYPHISTENSPLTAYKNYLIDYENPNGAGRITIK